MTRSLFLVRSGRDKLFARSAHLRKFGWLLITFAVVLAGALVRWLAPGAASASWGWGPASRTIVTLYFRDGLLLVPVSRWVPASPDVPRVALEALQASPAAIKGLSSPLPAGVALRGFALSDGVARVDFSKASPVASHELGLMQAAVVNTLTALPGVRAVSLTVDGVPLLQPIARVPLLYYVAQHRLVALPTAARTPQAALEAYLAGPSVEGLTGLPRDVRLLGSRHDPAEGVVRLDFSYTESLRELAFAFPDRMRLVLIGLIATLTEFPEVRAVRLDFQGRARLGLGQCSDLLRAPQRRPRLLNDERLLRRQWGVSAS